MPNVNASRVVVTGLSMGGEVRLPPLLLLQLLLLLLLLLLHSARAVSPPALG
jgi:hypothetical protein